MSNLKIKFNHEKDNSVECLGINEKEFHKKIGEIYEKLMPIEKHPEDWDVSKTSQISEILLKELPDEYIALMFMRSVHQDIQKRVKIAVLKQEGLEKLDGLLSKIRSSLKGTFDEEESDEKTSKKSKDDDIEDILKEIRNGLDS